MKNIQYMLLAVVFFAFKPIGAQDSALRLSLKKVEEIALANHPDIKVKETDILIAEENTALEKFNKYPTVFGDFNLQRNLIIPVTPVPAKAFDPSAPDEEIRPLKFSTKWTGNTGINASFDVFNPNSKGEVKIKNAEVEIAKTDWKMAENEVRFSAGKAYIAALIAAEQLQLNREESFQKRKTLEMLNSQFEEGRISLSEFNEGKAEFNLALAREIESEKIAEKANAQLLYEMGYNPETHRELIFIDEIETLFTARISMDEGNNESLSLKKLEQQREILEFKLEQERLRNYPTVSLSGYYGINYFDNHFDPFKGQNIHGNTYVKLGVSIPLTSWLTLEKNKRIVRQQSQANELSYQNQQNLLALNLLSARKDAESAYERYLKLKENFELAQANSKITKQRFEEGRIRINELYHADFSAQKAKNDYLNAAYDYIYAQLELNYESIK